jgi:hypothetical protein
MLLEKLICIVCSKETKNMIQLCDAAFDHEAVNMEQISSTSYIYVKYLNH